MPGKEWTFSEEQFVRENYVNMTCAEMAKQIGRTTRSVQHKFGALGLVRPLPQVGDKFGKLKIIQLEEKNLGSQNVTIAICQCECGKVHKIRRTDINKGRRKDCGCEHRKKLSILTTKRNYKHGKSQENRLFRIWCDMKARCYIPSANGYHNYGGRGIIVCEEWLSDFLVFEKWALTNGYNDELTIERKNVNGNYEPNNCCWVTMPEQANNKRNTIRITLNNETKTALEWSKDPRCVVSYLQITTRIRNGWSVEEALFTPKLSSRAGRKNRKK